MRDSVRTKSIRDAILDATDELLTKYGYKKMTIDDLAEAVGIGKGTVYLYFPSKEEIALSHIDRIIERLKTKLWEIATSERPLERKIKDMLVERVMFRFDAVQHYSAGLNDLLAQIRPRLLERRMRYFEEEAQVFVRVLEDGKQSGKFSGDPLETARLLLLASNSLLPYSLSTNELGSRVEIESRIGRLAELLLNGIVTG
jgi:AcrR family transcriptional regulator